VKDFNEGICEVLACMGSSLLAKGEEALLWNEPCIKVVA